MRRDGLSHQGDGALNGEYIVYTVSPELEGVC